MPKRYAVGRGMAYGFAHRSKEAGIVIWVAANYPSMPLLDHSFFFAKSVWVVLESKSRWSDEELKNVLAKCQAVRDILTMSQPTLRSDVRLLQPEGTA